MQQNHAESPSSVINSVVVAVVAVVVVLLSVPSSSPIISSTSPMSTIFSNPHTFFRFSASFLASAGPQVATRYDLELKDFCTHIFPNLLK